LQKPIAAVIAGELPAPPVATAGVGGAGCGARGVIAERMKFPGPAVTCATALAELNLRRRCRPLVVTPDARIAELAREEAGTEFDRGAAGNGIARPMEKDQAGEIVSEGAGRDVYPAQRRGVRRAVKARHADHEETGQERICHRMGFRVRPGKARNSREAMGRWRGAEFFESGRGYVGTELIRDPNTARRAAIDVDSDRAYSRFKKKNRASIKRLTTSVLR
jgi:hypothetical protein